MEYIVDFKPYKEQEIDISYYSDVEKRISSGESITQNEAENFLRVINYITRQKITSSMDNYDNKCDLAQSIIGHYLETIHCEVINCATQKVIAPNVVGHNFSIAKLKVEGEEKTYLIDPTYIQFFKKEKCDPSNYFLSPKNHQMVLLTPDPGYFIKKEDQDAADFLLRYGYIELTPEYAKMYGDSFYNTNQGVKLDPLGYQSMPESVYMKSFKRGREALSTSKEKLLFYGQNIVPFQEVERVSRKVI